MPELPEVETVRRTLTPRLIGRRVVRTRVFRAEVVRGGGGSAALGRGERVDTVLRRGKQLAIVFESGALVLVHLGMSGQLFVLAAGARPPRTDHLHVRWTLDDGSAVCFRDPRRFGGVWAYPSIDRLIAERWDALGPDAIRITARHLRECAGASRRAIKACLLDQGLLAGVGNIYADEALFLARLHPEQPANTLEPERWRGVASAVRRVLREGIEAGGSSLRDYVDADLGRGSHQTRHRVYGRAGAPCTRCGSVLRAIQVAQRTSTFCPTCQADEPGSAAG